MSLCITCDAVMVEIVVWRFLLKNVTEPSSREVQVSDGPQEPACVFLCAGNTVTGSLRHLQSAVVLIHPLRAAFLLPGNRDALSLRQMMSGWFNNVLFHVKSEHVLEKKKKIILTAMTSSRQDSEGCFKIIKFTRLCDKQQDSFHFCPFVSKTCGRSNGGL